MSLQDRIDDEIKNIKPLPDTLTKEEREQLNNLIDSNADLDVIQDFIRSCQ